MITVAIVEFFKTISLGMIGLVPASFGVPTFMSSGFDAIFSIFNSATSLSVWVPIPFALAGAAFRILVIVSGGAVKLARMLISIVTGGGGSAA